MRRGPKPAKSKEAKPPVRHISPKDNARVRDLEKRLAEAREQQAATAEILRVISQSPTDVQPVFDAIVRSAVTLCSGIFGGVLRLDGDSVHVVAQQNYPTQALSAAFPAPLTSDLAAVRAIREDRIVHIADVEASGLTPAGLQLARSAGLRSLLVVPMHREARTLGSIVVARREPEPFTDEQIALLQAFADQAVIAIENVRLFTELQEKNRALTQAHDQVSEALERQTATSEILSVISSSPTDVQPVFDTIVESAARLCDAVFSSLASFDGEVMDFVAAHNWTPAAWAIARRTFPAPPSRARATGRAILERAVVHMPDVELDHEYGGQIGATGSEISRAVGFRSLLSVPMLRDGVPLGAIAVARVAPGPFSDNQIALLKTFADQAVIAIENVRLFNETKEAL